jgi:SAM-dependent methyltransferase
MKPYRTGVSLTGLQDLIREHVKPGMRILEIGAFVGDSTREFQQAKAFVVSVDPWNQQMPGYHVEGSIFKAWAMNTRCWMGTALPFVGTGADFYRTAAVPNYAGRFDLAYIDAVHSYDAVRFDIAECVKLLRPGGKLAGHDYCQTHFPGVVAAVDEAAKRLGLTVKTYADTSWILVPTAKPKVTSVFRDGRWQNLDGSALTYDQLADLSVVLERELRDAGEWRYHHSEIEGACGGELALEVRAKVMRRRDAILAKRHEP